VPPIVINLLAGKETYNNAKTQLSNFYNVKIIPCVTRMIETLNTQLFWSMGYEVVVDYSKVPALVDARNDLIAPVVSLVSAGVITVNEARDMLNMQAIPGNDELVKPAAVNPFGVTMGLKKAVAPDMKKRAAAAKKMYDDFYARMVPKFEQSAIKYYESIGEDAVANMKASEARWNKMVADRDISAAVNTALRGIDEKTKQYADDLAKTQDAALLEMTPEEWTRMTQKEITQEEQDSAIDAASGRLALSNKKILPEVENTVHTRMGDYFKTAMEKNTPFDEMVKEVQTHFEGDDMREKYPHARMIARTETARALGAGNLATMKEAGFTRKMWIAGGPPNDRPEHTAIDGETVDIDKPFSIGLMFPGDPRAGVDQVANCRCTMVEAI
jgi:SPP1 gp7 family putative phage head morphogenesis protein